MLLPTLVVASILCSAHAERKTYSSDVRALIDKYRELTTAPADILRSFERIGEDSRELLNFGRPIGALLFNASFEEDSDEAKSMSELHKFIQDVQADANKTSQSKYGIEQKMRFIYNKLVALTNANRTSSEIETAVQILNRFLPSIFTRPRYLMDPYFDMFFYNIHDPTTVLGSIDYSALVNCRNVTDEERTKFGQVLNSFERLQSRISAELQEKLLRGWEFEMNDFLAIAMRAPASYVNWMAMEIDKIGSPSDSYVLYSNLSKIIRKKIEDDEARALAGWSDSCTTSDKMAQYEEAVYDYDQFKKSLPVITSTTFEFNTTVLLDELRKTRSDLLRLVLAKSIIMAAEPNEETFRDEAQEIAIALRQTGNYMFGFGRKIQDLSWPKIGIDSAKEAIGSERIAIDSYNETAQAIKSALEAQGSNSFAYQVLVVPSSRVAIDWSVASVKSDLPHMSSYTNIINFNGMDFHIFRFNQTEAIKRTSDAMKSFHKHSREIMREFKANGSKDDAATLLTKLNVHSPVFGKDLLRSVFLMKSVQVSVSTKLNTIEFEPVPFGLASSGTEPFVLDTLETLSWKLFYFL